MHFRDVRKPDTSEHLVVRDYEVSTDIEVVKFSTPMIRFRDSITVSMTDVGQPQM